MTGIIDRFVGYLADNGKIPTNDKGLYVYGLRLLGFSLLNLATALVLGLAFHMLWQTVIFLCAYIPLRRFAGGYHARSEFRCYLLSTALTTAALFVIRLCNDAVPLHLLIAALSAVLIFFAAPVEDQNKPLDLAEQIVYRKKSRWLLAAESAVYFVLTFMGQATAALPVGTAMITLSAMMLAGLLKNHQKAKQG